MSDSETTWADVEDDIEEYENAPELDQQQTIEQSISRFCVCRPVDDDTSLDQTLLYLLDTEPASSTINCTIDNIARCFNYVKKTMSSSDSVLRLKLTDYFYRIRHELLFKGLCLAYNLPINRSDTSFSSFGIESIRTPDMIYITDDNVILVIEVTASSSFDKAAQQKGVEIAGFESKYEKEIVELRSLGKKVSYCPIIFEMSDLNSKKNLPDMSCLDKYLKFNAANRALLRQIYNCLVVLTMNTRQFNVLPAALLFSDFLEIKQNHSNLEFLYTKEVPIQESHYRESKVSLPIYKKISNIWDRIPSMIDASEFEFMQVYLPVFKVGLNKLKFMKDKRGVYSTEYKDIIIRNDKPMFFNLLLVDTGSALIKANESHTGYKMVNKVKVVNSNSNFELPEIALGVSHHCQPWDTDLNVFQGIDISVYIKKLNIYNSNMYKSAHFDDNYERTIFNAIKQMDIEVLGGKDLEKCGYEANLGVPTLSSKRLQEVNINEEMAAIKSKMIELNSFSIGVPIKKYRVKQSFILPLSNVCGISYSEISAKNVTFIKAVSDMCRLNNPFTSEVLSRVLNEDYKMHNVKQTPSKHLQDLMIDRRRVTMEISKDYRKAVRELPKNERSNYRFRDNEDFVNKRAALSKLDKEILKLKKQEGVTEDISMVRLPSKNRKTEVGTWFQTEMAHFKKENLQSTTEGVGFYGGFESCYKYASEGIDEVISSLPVYAGENPDMVTVNSHMADDVPVLKSLKDASYQSYKDLIENVKNSQLGHSSALVSRMCHSLLFYSQMSFNAEKVRVDNLGYNDVLLVVRGGNKIFKSKSSKLYRLIYPISDSVMKLNTGYGSTNTILCVNGLNYCLTPWQLMHESVLVDGLSFYSRVVSFSVLNSNPNLRFSEQFRRIALNILLAFHNRRQSEVFLANLRYILLSCLGDFSGMVEIFNEFLGFNYDYFQVFLRGSFIINFPTYFLTLRGVMDSKVKGSLGISDLIFSKRLTNIFTGSEINDQNDMALMIYSTFLMTKAPYKRNVERASNLKGILKIHEEFDNNIGLTLSAEEQFNKTSVKCTDDDYKGYVNSLFGNDFNIDPSYISTLGVFANDLLSNKATADQISVEWIRIMTESWDSMATSTGLRGSLADVEDFWGKKGYFVVYKDLIKNFSFVKEINDLFRGGKTDDEKRKTLRKLNNSYLDKVDSNSDFWIFHAVDKTQWRGGREIYVMDIHTKQHQQPIEKFMGYLCRLLDNELISIPSDRRSQVIHHAIFEKDIDLQGFLTWYLTLDCSKWAPKSNFVKFAVMILNMSCIPSSFKTHFLNYLSKLYNKRIYFNDSEVEVLSKNPQYKAVIDKYLTKDEIVGGYFMVMPYSWVMGIFNYTSSFMHAVNQEYASYLISQSSIENLGEETTLAMYAHSDDSGGRISAQYKSLIQRGIFIYEINLKSCNHLLSKKKSVVSRFYFEILSIIYLFKQLLALLPKFLGGIRFLPTDKGPAQDMSQAYSKCIEVMVAGADFSIAYLVMNFYSALVWRFYYQRPPNINDFRRPVQLLGVPAAHPLMVLLCGSDSDTVRLIHSEGYVNLRPLLCLTNFLKGGVEDDSIIPGFQFKIQVRGIQKGFEEVLEIFKEEMNNWSIKYVNFKATPFNLLNFLSKLKDPGFVGSLVNESPVRRLSRSYFLRSGNSVITSSGPMSLNQIMSCIEICQLQINTPENEILKEVLGEGFEEFVDFLMDRSSVVSTQLKIIKTILSGPLKICDYLSSLSFTMDDLVVSHRTLKPTHLQITKSGTGFSTRFDPSVLVSYIKEPELRWALPDTRNMGYLVEELTKLCDKFSIDLNDVQPTFLLQLCRFFSSKSNKEIYLYSRVPSDLRQIKNYSSFLAFLSVNSFEGKEIKGMVLKLDRDIVGPDYLSSNINEDVHQTAIIFQILMSMVRVIGKEHVHDLPLNPVKEIDWEGGNVSDFCRQAIDKTLLDYNYNLVKLFSCYLLETIKYGECSSEILSECYFYSFTKRQKTGKGWFGAGQLLINCADNFYLFCLMNDKLISLETNFVGKMDTLDISYILEVFRNIGVTFDYRQLVPSKNNQKEYLFGYDWSSDVSILRNKEMRSGVPVTITYGKLGFMNSLSSYSLKYADKNKFKLIDKFSEYNKCYTIHGLESPKTVVIPTIKNLFNAADFEAIILQGGFGDFQEFIYNEILLDYGVESYIDLTDLIDNYTGSRIFEILSTARSEGLATIPTKMATAFYPAPQGGMLRVFYEYTKRYPESPIVKIPKSVNPDYMAIRSLFPEQFTAVLAESVQENYNKLFSHSERNEVLTIFKNLCGYEDIEMLREQLIKVLSYWGYTSLTNVVQLYNFSKDSENYYSLAWQGNQDSYEYHASLYCKLHTALLKRMVDFQHVISENDLTIEFLRPDTTISEFLDQFTMKNALSLYGFTYTGQCRTFQHIQFYNLLITYLTDEDFVDGLENDLKLDPLLSALPMSHKNRKELLAAYNNLKSSWQIRNKVDFQLDYHKRTQRLPENVEDPTTTYKSLSIRPRVAQNKAHHGQLNNEIKKFLTRDFNVTVNGIKYFVKSELKDLSDEVVPLMEDFKFSRMIDLEGLEGDPDWEDFLYEATMADIDVDTMGELLETLEGRLYKKSTTIVDDNKIYCRLTWVSVFATEGNLVWLDRLRQTGENLLLLTDCWIPFLTRTMNNVTVRRVNFSRFNWCQNFKDQEYLVYCIPGNKMLNDDFFDRLLGRNKIVVSNSVEESVYSSFFINHNKTIGPLITEFETKLSLLRTPEQMEQDRVDMEELKNKEREDKRLKKELLSNRGKLRLSLDDAVKDGILNQEVAKKMFEKYCKAISDSGGLKVEDILNDLFQEISLNKLVNITPELLKGSLTPEEHVMIMQTPKHWGLAFEQNRINKKMFNDKKIQIELGAIHEKLPDYIGSATLTISSKYGKILYSNMNLWRNATKNTKYKKANKEFLLTIFYLISNDAALCRPEEDTSKHDTFWREVIENTSLRFGDEGDEMDEAEMFGFFGLKPTSRIKYTPYQVYGKK